MRDGELSVDMVRHSVLLHARVELDLDEVLCILLESHLLNLAVERWFDLEAQGSLERTSVLDGQGPGDGLDLDVLLPEILELKLGEVELQGGSDEVAEDVGVDDWFGLPVATDNNLALPWLSNLTDLE